MFTLSFDKLIARFSKPINHFSRKVHVSSQLKLIPKSKELYVLVPPWHSKFDCYRIVRSKIKSMGYSYLEYKINSSLLSSDYQTTKKEFNAITHRIVSDIHNLKEDFKFVEIVIVGVSIGCIETMMVANNNHDITKVILVVPGNCLAESMWEGVRTANIRKIFEHKSFTLDFLKHNWKTLAPENNLEGLKDKKIEIYLSKSDAVIPYKLGYKLVLAMRDKGLKPLLKENKLLGHYGTAISFFLHPSL